jgi:hypothetical protein
MLPSTLIARLGALCYIAWGLFHVNVAHPLLRGLLPPAIYVLGALLTTAARRSAGARRA